MTEVTPYVDLTIFPRINYLKNFDARAVRRDLNGRIYGIYGIVSIDSERYPEIDGSTCLNGETSFTFDLGPNVTTTPTSIIDLRNDCGIATIIDLDVNDIAYTISNSGNTFNLRSTGTVNYTVDWGDGNSETSTSDTLAHTYTTAGTYVIKVNSNSGAYRPRFNNSGDEDQITLVAIGTNDSAVLGNSMQQAFRGADNMTEYNQASSATSAVTNFKACWQNCSGLTSFPLIDTSSGTDFSLAWRDTGLTSFPAIDLSSMTRADYAWYGCSSLADFPADMFDSTGTLISNAFDRAFRSCALNSTSIDNILVSIKKNVENGYSGTSGNTYPLTLNGGSSLARTNWSDTAVAAALYLEANNYTIYSN